MMSNLRPGGRSKDIHHREIDLIGMIRRLPGNPDCLRVQVNAKEQVSDSVCLPTA